MKTLAFVIGLYIATVGAIALLLPSGLVWVDQHFITPGTFFLAVIVGIAFGFVLISAAAASRTPKALRALGYFIVIIGIAYGSDSSTRHGMDSRCYRTVVAAGIYGRPPHGDPGPGRRLLRRICLRSRSPRCLTSA